MHQNYSYSLVSYYTNFLSILKTLGKIKSIPRYYMAQELLPNSSNKEKNDEEAALKGKIIQEHLESINMDAWYYIYQVYVNSQRIKK